MRISDWSSAVCSADLIAIAGGIKTAAGGGCYGSLQLLLNENYGLYEGSIMSAVGISIIPLILWYRRHGTIFPPDWRVSLFCFARSEERRVGKECVRTCSSRCSPYH